MEFRTASFGGVVAMALAWAFVWAFPGGVIEAIDNIAPSAHWFTRKIDMWPQTLGLPGLVGGVLFSVLLPITEARRRFAEVPLARSAAWGAVSGLVVGVLVVWGIDTGLADPWQLAAAVVGYATLMGTVSGAVSPFVFRFIARRRGSALPSCGGRKASDNEQAELEHSSPYSARSVRAAVHARGGREARTRRVRRVPRALLALRRVLPVMLNARWGRRDRRRVDPSAASSAR
ncbi:MAG: hypothetical protein ACRELD_03425 [Longimicrobiales bacterium]